MSFQVRVRGNPDENRVGVPNFQIKPSDDLVERQGCQHGRIQVHNSKNNDDKLLFQIVLSIKSLNISISVKLFWSLM